MYTSEEQHKMAITEEVGQAQTDAQSFTAPRRPHYPRVAARLGEFARRLRQTRLLELAQSRCLLQQVPAVRASSHSLPSLTTQALAMDHLASAGISCVPESRAKRTEACPNTMMMTNQTFLSSQRQKISPTDNAFIESFNGRLRQECLNQNWFLSVADARETIENWRQDHK